MLAGLGLRGGVEEIDCENLKGTQSVHLFANAVVYPSFRDATLDDRGRVAGDDMFGCPTALRSVAESID